jgi:light-regulated signal transduction histidine kinase (bacteriophytochrome)
VEKVAKNFGSFCNLKRKQSQPWRRGAVDIAFALRSKREIKALVQKHLQKRKQVSHM